MNRSYLLGLTALVFSLAGCGSTVTSRPYLDMQETDGTLYALPLGQVSIKLEMECSLSPEKDVLWRFKSEPEIKASISGSADERFVATLNSGWLSDDNLRVTTTADGLLKSVEAVSTDLTAKFVTTALSLFGPQPGLLAGLLPDVDAPTAALPGTEDSLSPEAKACIRQPVRTGVAVIRQTPVTNSWAPLELKRRILASPDLSVYARLMPAWMQNGHRQQVKGKDGAVTERFQACHWARGKIKGLCHRPIADHLLSIYIDNPDNPMAKYSLPLPDMAISRSVRVERKMFVTSKTGLAFKSGVLVSNKVSRPSQAVGALNLLLDIPKGILSVPGELVKLKIDLDSVADETLKDISRQLETQEQTIEQVQQAVVPGVVRQPPTEVVSDKTTIQPTQTNSALPSAVCGHLEDTDRVLFNEHCAGR